MNEAQTAVFRKMQYVIEQIGKGPLNCMEEGELLEGLQNLNDSSIWGIAIKNHFTKPKVSDSEFIRGLGDQCKDDIFTMSSIVGLNNAILLLRSLSN